MFKKILIAEDIDTLTLDDIILKKYPDTEIIYSRYCDDALLRMKRAAIEGKPFDLLITDLSFIADHRDIILAGGAELIGEVRKIQPKVNIIAYSIEDRIYKIRFLLDNLKVNGYVWKGRESTVDMRNALDAIADGQTFLSPRFADTLRAVGPTEISEYDKKIITMLAEGMDQAKISESLSKQGFPGSKSNVEKHINHLKIALKANNIPHLISIAKDLGII